MGKSVSFGYAQHLIATVQANPAAGRSPALLMTNSTGQDPECMCKPTPCHLKPCQHTFLQSFENLVVGPMPDWLWPPVPAGCVRGEFASQFALGKCLGSAEKKKSSLHKTIEAEQN